MREIDIEPFKPVTLGVRDRFLEAGAVLKRESCECSFANIFSWRYRYDSHYTEVAGRMMVLGRTTGCLLFPQGTWFAPEELERIRARTAELEGGAIYWGDVPEDYLEEHREELESIYEISCTEDDCDYVYCINELAEVRGVKHRNTRRLMHQFEASFPDAEMKQLNAEDGDAVFELIGKIHEEDDVIRHSETELVALREALANFTELELDGVQLVDILGNMLAFSIWSYPQQDMVNVHFEKALLSVYGAAQTIRVGVARRLRGNIKWVNLEQDLGIRGLRRSKESYAPHHMVMRYFLHPRGGV